MATPDNSLTGMSRNGNETGGNIWIEDTGTGIEDDRSLHGAEERKEICSGTSIAETHTYRNQQWSLIIALMTSR